MNFSEYTYVRPDMDEAGRKFEAALERFRGAASADEQNEAMKEFNQIRNDIGTMFNLCYIRHSIDTNDEFYKNEQDYMDEVQPQLEGFVTDYYKELVDSKFRSELEEK
ncbi:M3 family oligoendopeptidase, partial [Bacillus mobilis]